MKLEVQEMKLVKEGIFHSLYIVNLHTSITLYI